MLNPSPPIRRRSGLFVRLVIPIGLVALAAGCSSDGDAEPDVSVAPSTTIAEGVPDADEPVDEPIDEMVYEIPPPTVEEQFSQSFPTITEVEVVAFEDRGDDQFYAEVRVEPIHDELDTPDIVPGPVSVVVERFASEDAAAERSERIEAIHAQSEHVTGDGMVALGVYQAGTDDEFTTIIEMPGVLIVSVASGGIPPDRSLASEFAAGAMAAVAATMAPTD